MSNFIPIEYLNQIISCEKSEDGKGYLNLLMMQFTEYFQEHLTGIHKISLPELKYSIMSKEFIVFCKGELLRRNNKLLFIKQENLFNPNMKTKLITNSPQTLRSSLPEIEQLNLTVQ